MQLKIKRGPKAAPVSQRLAKYTLKTSSCWLWTGYKNEDGYGKLRVAGKNLFAHRLAWSENHGEIPGNLNVCHRCDTPGCINPEHLFLGTHSENMKDCVRKGRKKVSDAFKASGAKGERNRNSKLNEQQVILIRESVTPPEIEARKYGITRASIQNIRAKRTWGHI